VFVSALEQWDGLHAAAATVPSSVSPILLYYALGQACRALAAANIKGQPWRATSHGLHVSPPDRAGALGQTVVAPDSGVCSALRLLCESIDSPTLTEPVTLGALWAANPHAERAEGLGDHEPRGLELNRRDGADGAPSTTAMIGTELVTDLSMDVQEAERQVEELLKPYPNGRGPILVLPGLQGRGPQVAVTWLRPDQGDGEARLLSEVAPPFCGPRSGAYLRPALNDADETLAPLAMWFGTLFALSILARYHPERWTSALNRDGSRLAIPIEETLDAGWELLPHLLLDALSP
jgi:hypothetical protein